MNDHDEYDFKTIESRWQDHWLDTKVFKNECSPKSKKPYYILSMYPYPSGTLHMGHVINYTIGDVLVRSRMMMGYDVLSPMGWDAFGLPAENAAIKNGIPPADFTRENIDKMRVQMRRAGWGFDWDREMSTAHPGYYRWTQWIFLKLHEMGLAIRKKAPVNWCGGTCQTVLANEQVHDGKCERCASEVEPRDMTQWFFAMSQYAQRLLDDHEKLRGRWPDRVIHAQEEWIGRSEGARIDFAIESTGETLGCFTTRPDTLFGVTYMSIAPEHPLVESLVKGTDREKEVMDAVRRMRMQSAIERTSEESEKIGVDLGHRVINPANGESVPLWAASYALMGYGTGAVMAVPAHDQRDFLFAKKYDLPIRVVIRPEDEDIDALTMTEAYVEPGVQVHSGAFDGIPNEEGKKRIVEHLVQEKKGEATIQYGLRDWLISRQRYWGAPIPIVHCGDCGEVPVPEKDLPVLLPDEIEDFNPKGKSPLETVESFVATSCPSCGKAARRETDTMDTFVDSSWYFIRYLYPRNDEFAFDADGARGWMPVHQYIGGIEHATMHLVYCRFIFKCLCDAGLLPFDEPAERLFCQGMVCNTAHRCENCTWLPAEKVTEDSRCADCGGEVISNVFKMSKSKLNGISPDEILERSGADALRLSILMAGPADQDVLYKEEAVVGARRFLGRLWETVMGRTEVLPPGGADPSSGGKPEDSALRRKVHQTIGRVTDALERTFGFNTAIAAVMELLNTIREDREISPPVLREAVETATLCISPFAPHIAEELWRRLGHETSITEACWPVFDKEIAAEQEVEIVFQVNGKLRGKRRFPVQASREELERAALEDEAVIQSMGGAKPLKVIVVPGKLVNIVIKK